MSRHHLSWHHPCQARRYSLLAELPKRRKRIHGDVVESLQILKSAFRHSNMSYFKDLPTLKTEEDILEEERKEDELMISVQQKVKGGLAIDLDDDCYETD